MNMYLHEIKSSRKSVLLWAVSMIAIAVLYFSLYSGMVKDVADFKIEGETIEITSLKGIENLDKIISLLSDYGEKIRNIASESASLETVFLKLTGRKLRD